MLPRTEQIFLVVIEIRRHVPRIVLFGRRGVASEVDAIPFPAFDEMHVAQVAGRVLDGIDDVAQHGDIFLDAFHTAFAVPGAGAVENVRDAGMLGERAPALGGIPKIGR